MERFRPPRFSLDRADHQYNLVIANFTTSDSGFYTCTDNDGYGDQHTTHLIVLETIYDADINATVGQKVTLPCHGLAINSSTSWLYRQRKSSNSRVIFSATGDKTVVFQPSGRFAANRTTSSTFALIIYEVQLTDAGFYGCASGDIYRIIRLRIHHSPHMTAATEGDNNLLQEIITIAGMDIPRHILANVFLALLLFVLLITLFAICGCFSSVRLFMSLRHKLPCWNTTTATNDQRSSAAAFPLQSSPENQDTADVNYNRRPSLKSCVSDDGDSDRPPTRRRASIQASIKSLSLYNAYRPVQEEA